MRIGLFVLIAGLAMLPGPAPAQPPVPAAGPAAADGRTVVAEIRRVLAANYVLPDARPRLDAALAKGLAEGRYDVSDPAILVERINSDLGSVTKDKHLGMHHDPAQAAQLAGGTRRDDGPPSPEQMKVARQRNHGIVELKWLSGNIRYMELRGFTWTGPESARAYDDAMRFLGGGDAVIIDLRRNGGGSPAAVQYLVSHFMEADRPLVTFHMGASQVDRLATLKSLPAGRMVGKPLYILTSADTASAAEEFTGHVAGFRLGEVIGETTAGAGFRNQFFALPGGYVISVSVGRAVLASTGKDWEGIGIAPTAAVARDKALDLAKVKAMRRVAAAASPEDRKALEASADVLAAQIEPVRTALPIEAYSGTFGERVVRVEQGALVWQRGTGPKLRMVALGPNLFAFEEDPAARVEFKVAGNAATGFELLRGDGSRDRAARTP